MTQSRTLRLRLLLAAALVIALAFTGYHAMRLTYDAMYWHEHRDEPIERWMTLGYVAHSYHVPPHVLHQALGLPIRPDHRPIGRIARERGTSVDAIKAKLTYAIVHARPPYPPPGPPSRPTQPPR